MFLDEKNFEPSSQITNQAITSRIKSTKNTLSDDTTNYKYLNPSNIRISGMVDYAIKYMKEKNLKANDLTMNDYHHISVRFGGNPNTIFNNVKTNIYNYIKD